MYFGIQGTDECNVLKDANGNTVTYIDSNGEEKPVIVPLYWLRYAENPTATTIKILLFIVNFNKNIVYIGPFYFAFLS